MKLLLAIGALSLALAGCGSSSSKTATVTSAPSSTSTQSSSTTQASTSTRQSSSRTPSGQTVHLTSFKSPTGNIGCVMNSDYGRCDIAKRSWKPPPKPAGCPLDFGQGLEIDSSGAGHFVCAGDTAMNPQAPVLAYGDSSRIGPITCASESGGMTCTNTDTGHGFFISIQAYRGF